MPSYSSLDIHGFQGFSVPNTFIKQDVSTTHLAVVFPGFGYQASMPVLYYPGIILLNNGADLLNVEYSYSRNTQFLNAPADQRERWLAQDASASLQAGIAQRAYTRITLIGKSLGTVAIGYLLGSEEQVKDAQCVWLTPLLKNEKLLHQITNSKPRSLFVTGTADEHYDDTGLQGVVKATGGAAAVIQGADHSLEIAGDIPGTIDVMRRIVLEVEKFISI